MSRLKLFVSVFVVFELLSTLPAQTVNATLRGTVKDASGAVIPGAAVKITNVEKGISRSLTTDASGDYVAPQLPAQTYSITAGANGFRTETHDDFVLQVGQEARLDFTLAVGNAADQVTIREVAPLIQSEDSSAGGVIDEKKVKELPLNGRQFWQLAYLIPEVTMPVQNSTLSTRGGFNVAGAYEVSNNFILDGIDDNDRTTGQPSVRPSVDGIQEFRVLTGTYEAEYGRQSGGQVLITTKSGNNEFHGTAFEFFRNNNLDSRNFFSPGDLLPFTRNQYGGSLGGPILKNKTFFFVTYEGLGSKQVNVVEGTVPTAAERQGIFPSTINNPAGGVFPNNQIPLSQLSSTSLALLQYYPLPNLNAPAGGLNFVNSDPTTSSFNQFSTRLDQVISARNNLFGTYQYYDSYDWAPSTVPGFGTSQPQRFQHASITDDHIFSAAIVNELRAGYNRLAGLKLQQDYALGDQVAALGLPQGTTYGLEPTTKLNGGIPGISITGVGGLTGIGQAGNPQWRADNTWNYVESLTWTHGKHTMKFGTDYQSFSKHSYFETDARGAFTFNGQYTGNAFADFLLGDMRTSTRGTGDPNQHPYTKADGMYAQDEWKVLPSLTINIGLRYELFAPQKERTNKISQFDLQTGLLNDGQGNAWSVNPTTGLLVDVGKSDLGDTLYKFPLTNFAPRFGFAYRATNDNKTVIRGGYGIFYDQNVVGNGVFQFYGLGTPYLQIQTFTNTPTAQGATWADPFPAGTSVGSYTTGAINPNFPTAYVQQWTFGVQRELISNLLLEVSYQGSKGTHLPLTYNINTPVPGPGAIQARRPYPDWGTVTWVDDVSASSYNSLTTRLERRYAGGLTFNTSFVYSKSLDYGSPPSTSAQGDAGVQNPLDIAAEWGRSDFDQKFRYIASVVYDLPFGRGRRWMSSAPRTLDLIAGGWESTAILTLQDGRPFTVTTSKDIANTGGADRPFVVGNPFISNPSVAEWFNTAAFSNVVPGGGYSWGNAGRNILNAPGVQNLDFGLYKNFRLSERVGMQFRAEAFNALNHANFSIPTSDANSSTFGQISSTQLPNRDLQFGLKILF
jgi:Carboxypeptidase regulatory-like domain